MLFQVLSTIFIFLWNFFDDVIGKQRLGFSLLRWKSLLYMYLICIKSWKERQSIGIVLFFYDKVWYMSSCLIWLVHCYYTLSSYHIDLPCMAHSSSSYCIDIPFMVYSTDLSANCAVKCFNFPIRHVAAVMIWGQSGSTTLLLRLKPRKP